MHHYPSKEPSWAKNSKELKKKTNPPHLFWDNCRFTCSCKKWPLVFCQFSLYNYSAISQPGNQHWYSPPTYLNFMFYMHSCVCVSVQFSSVAQSCPTLCDSVNCSMPGLPVHHQLPEFTQTHVHRVSDAIQPSPPLSSPSLPAPNPSQHQGLFQWVNSLHEVAKVLEFQL